MGFYRLLLHVYFPWFISGGKKCSSWLTPFPNKERNDSPNAIDVFDACQIGIILDAFDLYQSNDSAIMYKRAVEQTIHIHHERNVLCH